jgi:hypothetical protein
MKAILINSENIVENIIVWDESCTAPEGLTSIIVEDDFLISTGWIYNGNNTFTDPNPPNIDNSTPAVPTLQQLQTQLAILAAQIQALSNT